MALSWFGQGCSSSYEPARSPHVSMVMEGGQVSFVRNGEHRHGLLIGNSLIDAVTGDPVAEAEAHTARNLEVGGLVFLVGGLGTLVGGVAVAASDHGSDSKAATVSGLFLTSIACDLVSLAFTLNAVPHVYDAMNIYNDDLDRTAPAPFPVRLPPPFAPPRAPEPAQPMSPASAPSLSQPAAAPREGTPASPPSAAFPAEPTPAGSRSTPSP
jgi:hypothetical protein